VFGLLAEMERKHLSNLAEVIAKPLEEGRIVALAHVIDVP
jgi:hypothetical protein